MAGRPNKYFTHVKPYLEYISGWCISGATDKQIAEKLGVALSSFMLYKKQFPELSEALRVTKELADLNVVSALYQRAVGFEYEEVKESTIEDFESKKVGETPKQSNAGRRTYVTVTRKRALPHPGSAIRWLAIRCPGWRESAQDDDLHGQYGVLKVGTTLPEEEWLEEAQKHYR